MKILRHLNLTKPTVLIDKHCACCNIERMKQKAERSDVELRPHFKTHQSAEVGEWFREKGCNKITVSSVEMAKYFAASQWDDITISTLFNILQIEEFNRISEKISFNIVVDNFTPAASIAKNLNRKTGFYVKIDTGNKRCGLTVENTEIIEKIIFTLLQNRHLHFKGILSHSGHTYLAHSIDQVHNIYLNDKLLLQNLKFHLENRLQTQCMISIGDTPGCSIADFSWADEIRPGNFVFYDLQQLKIGCCDEEDLACVVVCPVIGSYPQRGEMVIYGGAVHFSKDTMAWQNESIYGLLALPDGDGILKIVSDIHLTKLWQEHGLLKFPKNVDIKFTTGDTVYIFPIHSCLTIDSVRSMQTTEGQVLTIMKKGSIIND